MINSEQDGAPQERRSNNDHDTYFNSQFAAKPYYIEPGQSLCGNSVGEMVVATLGSGVAVTVHDRELGIGGMAYILIPDSIIETFPHFDRLDPAVINKICWPIEECIRDMKTLGAGKGRIRIRLIGGASMPDDILDRGTKNYLFVKNYLVKKGLSIMSEDLAGPYIRRVHFFPSSGRAVRRILRRQSDFAHMRLDEKEYEKQF